MHGVTSSTRPPPYSGPPPTPPPRRQSLNTDTPPVPPPVPPRKRGKTNPEQQPASFGFGNLLSMGIGGFGTVCSCYLFSSLACMPMGALVLAFSLPPLFLGVTCSAFFRGLFGPI